MWVFHETKASGFYSLVVPKYGCYDTFFPQNWPLASSKSVPGSQRMACRSPFGDRWAAKQHLSWSICVLWWRFNRAAHLEDASHRASCRFGADIMIASIHPGITIANIASVFLHCFKTFVELHEWLPWHSRHEFHGRSCGPRQDEATWGLPSSVRCGEMMTIDVERRRLQLNCAQPFISQYQTWMLYLSFPWLWTDNVSCDMQIMQMRIDGSHDAIRNPQVIVMSNSNYTPKANMDTKKIPIVERKFLFQTIIFRVHVSFRECNDHVSW